VTKEEEAILMDCYSVRGPLPAKRTITVVIPALNEEKNIGNIVDDVLRQELGLSLYLDKVTVVSDGSTDRTNEIVHARRAADSRVELVVNSRTFGQAQSINVGIGGAESDFAVLLDGDVRLSGPDTLRNLLEDVGPEVGLIGGNPVPAPGQRNLAESVADCGDLVWKALKLRVDEGRNIYSAHGRVLGLSRSLYSSAKVPRKPGSELALIPADQFFYLTCVSKGLTFELRSGARVLYKLPESIRDYVRQSTRFTHSISNTKTLFDSSMVEREYRFPLRAKAGALADAFLEKPLVTPLWGLLQVYCRSNVWVRRHLLKKSVRAAWEISQSTKDGIDDF
jgi:glycosyltransferase involved in cell wall biosynthesis